jgi:hypothetical protein
VWKRLGYWPNFRAPRTFNEHFLREKVRFTGDLALAKVLTDKIDAKDWLTAHGYGAHIVPTILTAESVDELRGRPLPKRCVIKPAHSSGDLIILNESVARELAEKELRQVHGWLKEDYYRRGREPNYAGLTPRVIVEELLLDQNGQPPQDYKIECAAGIPFMVQVDINRFTRHVRQLYTPEWQLLPYCTSFPRHPEPQPAPSQLPLALSIAQRLSAPFRLCRIDLYFLGQNDVRIGEITFYPANCAETFDPPSGDADAGKLISKIFSALAIDPRLSMNE